MEKVKSSKNDFALNPDGLLSLCSNQIAPDLILAIMQSENRLGPNRSTKKDTLTNTKIINLVQCGFQPSFIISQITTSINFFSVEVNDLINLYENKVTLSIQLSMMEAMRAGDTVQNSRRDTLTNAKIIKLSKIGFGSEFLINKIHICILDFILSPSALKELKKQGVPAAVIEEMKTVMAKNESVSAPQDKYKEVKEDKSAPLVQEKKIEVPLDTLTNDKIIQLTNIGLQPSAIIAKIRAGLTLFNVSTDAIIVLRKNNVALEVIDEMIKVTLTDKNETKIVSSTNTQVPEKKNDPEKTVIKKKDPIIGVNNSPAEKPDTTKRKFSIMVAFQPGFSFIRGDWKVSTSIGILNLKKNTDLGYKAEINCGYNFNDHFGLSIGLGYSHQTQSYDYQDDFGTEISLVMSSIRLSYLNIPIKLNFTSNPDRSFSFLGFAGINIAFLAKYELWSSILYADSPQITSTGYRYAGKTLTVEDNYRGQYSEEQYDLIGKPFKSSDFGLTFGAGCQKKLNSRLYLELMFNYHQGLRDIKNVAAQIRYSNKDIENVYASDDPNRLISHKTALLGIMAGLKWKF